MADETTQANVPGNTQTPAPTGGVAQPAPAAPSAPAAPASPADASVPAVPTAPAAAPAEHPIETFKRKYQALVAETGHSINVEPKYIKRDDGSYSTILETTILPIR